MPSWDELGPLRQTHLIAETRAACLAMLRAWPGMERQGFVMAWRADRIILPLTEEASDE
jgi:hypothetical protein